MARRTDISTPDGPTRPTRPGLVPAVGIAATAWLAGGADAAAQDAGNRFGAVVTNIAEVTYQNGDEVVSEVSNEAVFTIRPPNTPATIEFFRNAPTASAAVPTIIRGSDYSPSGELDGPFETVGPAVTAGGREVDTSVPVPLLPATTFLADEVMFIRVTDMGANRNSTEIDVIVITLTSDLGDSVVLRLYETGPDTGEFFAYLPTTRSATILNDTQLSVGEDSQIQATYVNAFDSTDIVVDTAAVNPLNHVFSSVTGEEIAGAVITLRNVDTGQEATVLGVDGFSAFPAEVTSGGDVTDASGLFYDNEGGEFRFPQLEPGTYVIDVEPPEGFVFASSLSSETILGEKSEFGYVLGPGSFGQPFTIEAAGPLLFDIPLDPLGDLVVVKEADRTFGDVGDYINYTVTVQNVGTSASVGRLHDTLPVGFRYVPGTTRIEQVFADDPTVADDAALLTFDFGAIAPGQTVTLDYALQIGPGAVFGTAINEAVMRSPDGVEQISNIGRAAIELREDLLRQRSTIIGRVTEQSCDGDDGWARPIARGIGVSGVRLYMETGAYAVSDPDGLFHFEGVREGTHVVQVDEETLPQGYELMTCEENTRLAGVNNSQFVDVQGGGIWRANFYLKQTGETAVVEAREDYNARTDYENYDIDWLDTQDATPSIAYPGEDRTPSQTATHLGIVHGSDQTVSLVVNGRDVPTYLRSGSIRSTDGTVALSRYRGVPLETGRNVIVATIRDRDGETVTTLRRELHYVKTIARVIPMPDRSVLVADGRTVPEIAIRLEDEGGRAVHAGRITRLEVEPPYAFHDETGLKSLGDRERFSEALVSPLSAAREVSVGADGIVRARLEPTLQTGKVTVNATLDNGRVVPVYMNLVPEKRDWILVGLAEGSAALDRVRGNASALIANGANPDAVPSEDVMTDGRVAFFAKGMIKGEWLMTLALDTDKRKSRRGSRADGDFLSEIDPNAYYTLYGDRSYQEYEAQSRYPLYVKLEKQQAYALFGDFHTNVTEGRLTAYNRRLSGLKSEYLGEDIQVLGFAAETNQGFALDEIAADGTSGVYRLSNSNILAQSEEIVIETRDRVRPDVVLERRTMVRYLDYTLDYLTGELLFRLPVDATDADFNPKVIVADYETSQDAERNVTFGGRVQAQLGEDDRVQIGSTFVHEDGSNLAAGSESDQIGVDLQVKVSDNTHVRLEYAVTDTDGQPSADAKLAEVIHTSDRVAAEAYFREQDAGFGLGQRTSNTTSVRRYGARANYRLSETDDEETGERTTRRVEAQAYREENLSTGDARNAADVTLRQDGHTLNASAGLRVVRDELVDRDNRNSLLATAGVAYNIDKHDATVQLTHEQPLGGKDEVSSQPMRTSLAVSKQLGSRAQVTVRHDLLDGEFTRSNNTSVGATVTPWKGGQLTAASDMITNDSGRRIGATVGLDQQVRIDDHWSVSAGLRDRTVLDSDSEYEQVAPDAAVSAFERNEDFTSAYVGLGYTSETTTGSVRGETRIAGASETYIGSLSAARSLTEVMSLAGSARLAVRMDELGERDTSVDVRLGASWRPRDEGLVVFDRFDVSHRDDSSGFQQTKVVNNLAANTWINDRWQLTGNWGVKYTDTTVAGQSFDNVTNLLGAETRYDVRPKVDVGMRGQVMLQSGTDGAQYSYGPSVGFTPAKNVWISAGYNVEGFKDDDFEASEYSRKGPYVTMRIKFDQNTAEGLLRRISPSSITNPARSATALSQPETLLRPAPVTQVSAPLPESVTCWDGVIVTDLSACAAKPVATRPAAALIETPVPSAPVPDEVEAFLCADGVTTVSDTTACPVPRADLNVCKESAIDIFDVPPSADFKQMTRLGVYPEFGESHDLSARQFFDKLDVAHASNDAHKAYLDYLFRSMGYANGWDDATPDLFSEAVLPEDTRGVLGMGEDHHYGFRILPSELRDRQTFRIEPANGQVVHFMKSCGNYFYGCQ